MYATELIYLYTSVRHYYSPVWRGVEPSCARFVENKINANLNNNNNNNAHNAMCMHQNRNRMKKLFGMAWQAASSKHTLHRALVWCRTTYIAQHADGGRKICETEYTESR